jgi:hypothetical protein
MKFDLSLLLLALAPLMVFVGGKLTDYSDKPTKKKEPNFVERGIIEDWTKQQIKTDDREQ